MITPILLFLASMILYRLKEMQAFGVLPGGYLSFWHNSSWHRKYKGWNNVGLIPAPNTWYYRMFNIKYKEAFPLSTTALVWLTDGFHLMQFLHRLTLALSITLWGGFSWYWFAAPFLMTWAAHHGTSKVVHAINKRK